MFSSQLCEMETNKENPIPPLPDFAKCFFAKFCEIEEQLATKTT